MVGDSGTSHTGAKQYSLTDVASFTQWYLRDYPVQCRIRDDGFLVVGAPKGSVWKHDISTASQLLHDAPLWCGGIFLLALECVLLLAYFVVRRWFRQAQQVRDAAWSGWINGISHDIRTPLDVVLGTAAQLEPDGGAAHGTGLKLVSQIAAAHGGEARFYGGGVFRCELRLPLDSGGPSAIISHKVRTMPAGRR